MSSGSRYIDVVERRQLWSLLLIQAVPFIFSWYCIERIASEDECGRLLRHNYTFISPYMFVPDICTWEKILWFRLNRLLMFSIFTSSVLVQAYYEISNRYLVFILFITSGLAPNIYRAEKRNNIFYRDVPILLMLLANVLYLEIHKFIDRRLDYEQSLVQLKNLGRRDLREAAKRRCWDEVIEKIRNNDDESNIRSIIQEAEKRVAEYEHLHPRESLPTLPSTTRHVTEGQALIISIIVHVLYFGLFIVSVKGYLVLIYKILRIDLE